MNRERLATSQLAMWKSSSCVDIDLFFGNTFFVIIQLKYNKLIFIDL